MTDIDRPAGLREALTVALTVALHEHFDPDCDGSPPYEITQEQAVALVADVFKSPLLHAALAELEVARAARQWVAAADAASAALLATTEPFDPDADEAAALAWTAFMEAIRGPRLAREETEGTA